MANNIKDKQKIIIKAAQVQGYSRYDIGELLPKVNRFINYNEVQKQIAEDFDKKNIIYLIHNLIVMYCKGVL